MEEYICAFSSDYRELYKADIYKVLSMPNDFVIHFRYKLKYIEQSILDNIKANLKKDVIIFYSPNNDLTNVSDNLSIRKAKLVRAEISQDTGLFHAFLKLGDFCNATIDKKTINTKLPSVKFFSKINCSFNQDRHKWFEKVDDLKSHFPNLSFYQIKSIKTVCGINKKVMLRNDKKSSYYKLNHGEKYIAELSIANPSETDCKILFKSSSDDISANLPNPIEVTAYFDDISVPIYLKSLNVSTESSFISFTPKNGKKVNSEYSLNIEIEKRIGFKRPILFGIYSLITVLAIWIIKDHSESISYIGNWSWNLNWRLIGASVALLVSSSLLFSQFNKK